MADALLSPPVGMVFGAASLAAIRHSSRKLSERQDEGMIPSMGVMGAFIFAGQMINFTIPGTGSSGHIGGGILLAATLGPHAAFIVMASALTVQALLFADGGLLALGCNIWNLGFYPAFVVYPLIFRPIAGINPNGGRILLASLAGAVAALQLGAFSVVLETFFSGRSELPFGAFALLMQSIHLAIGAVEGVITAGVLNYVRHVKPELLYGAAGDMPSRTEAFPGRLIVVFAVLAMLTGGVLSWFASAHPDGLEWSVEKVYGKPELPGQQGIPSTLKSIQHKTAVLPGYGFKSPGGETPKGAAPAWPAADIGVSVSGITGSAAVFGLILLTGMAIRALRAKWI